MMGSVPAPARRRIRICYFNTWATQLEPADRYLARVRQMDIAPFVTDPGNAGLMRKARLDCDWYGENLRCFAAMQHPDLEFLPALVAGAPGIAEFTALPREPGEEKWFIVMGQQPQSLGASAGKVFSLLSRMNIRIFFYAFDEASRTMPCFGDIAPSLDILIHDERPLESKHRAKLKPGCKAIHRSWVANVLPFATPFNPSPEERIVFLGSQLGLTPHRQRQIEFLRARFGEKFVGFYDHSVDIGARDAFSRYKVGFCPEGRKFGTPSMSQSHTDRPFWSGCLGMVPVSEDSKSGGRLQSLHEQQLIVRYRHADLDDLARACEQALEMSDEPRRRIYDHFNAHETVGTVVANAIAAAQP